MKEVKDMRSIKIFLLIFVFTLMFPCTGFSDDKDKLIKSIDSFKPLLINEMYPKLLWGAALDSNAIMNLTNTVVTHHDAQPELLPFIQTQAEEYAANGDLSSLLIMTIMHLHYIPLENMQTVSKLLMVLQTAVVEVIKEHDATRKQVISLLAEKFKNISPEFQRQVVEKSNAVLKLVSQQHYPRTSSISQYGNDGILNSLRHPLSFSEALLGLVS